MWKMFFVAVVILLSALVNGHPFSWDSESFDDEVSNGLQNNQESLLDLITSGIRDSESFDDELSNGDFPEAPFKESRVGFIDLLVNAVNSGVNFVENAANAGVNFVNNVGYATGRRRRNTIRRAKTYVHAKSYLKYPYVFECLDDFYCGNRFGGKKKGAESVVKAKCEADSACAMYDWSSVKNWGYKCSSGVTFGGPDPLKVGTVVLGQTSTLDLSYLELSYKSCKKKRKEFCENDQNIINQRIETAYFANVPYGIYIKYWGANDVFGMNKYQWNITAHIQENDNQIIVATKNNACLVAFGGYDPTAGWSTTLGVLDKLANFQPYVYTGDSGQGTPTAGFYKHAQDAAASSLKKYFKKGGYCYDKKVVITGHSMGGAVAVIFTAFLRTAARDLAKRPKNDLLTFTYGQPRTYHVCPDSIRENPRIHRYVMAQKTNGDYVMDIATTRFLSFLGPQNFCNPGYEMRIDSDGDPDADGSQLQMGTELGVVYKNDRSWPNTDSTVEAAIGRALHASSPYYYYDLDMYDYSCETNYN